MKKPPPLVSQTKILLSPDSSRVVLRRFAPHPESRLTSIIGRVVAMSEKEVECELKKIIAHFTERHLNIEETFLEHYESVKSFCDTDRELSETRKSLIGAYFTHEYSIESTALFNPSIVAHPDQSELPEGAMRFIMSLRAIGEGHISSLMFRTGIIDSQNTISFDEVSRYAGVAHFLSDSLYDKLTFKYKLAELGFDNDFSNSFFAHLPDSFTIQRLQEELSAFVHQKHRYSESDKLVHDKITWLAFSNYVVSMPAHQPLSYGIVFPASPAEKNGIEDARFVRFVDDDGSIQYYATYTAYDGRVVLPQLIETDFKNFKMITLNGKAIKNKGMALFPRKINGKFAMLSRQDNDSIFLMYSDNIHFWQEAQRIVRPKYEWEFIQIGNCGSPIETEEGWLVLTHGVGAIRQYAIGAILLDRADPSKVIGRLSKPLLVPCDSFRDGYVPNVVYTCGCIVHHAKLIIPYAFSDLRTTVAIVDLQQLLHLLTTKA